VVLADHAKHILVAGEIDFHEHVLGGHVLQKLVRVVLIRHVRAVADTLGACNVHRLAHVTA
jgi:hypothetical protein